MPEAQLHEFSSDRGLQSSTEPHRPLFAVWQTVQMQGGPIKSGRQKSHSGLDASCPIAANAWDRSMAIAVTVYDRGQPRKVRTGRDTQTYTILGRYSLFLVLPKLDFICHSGSFFLQVLFLSNVAGRYQVTRGTKPVCSLKVKLS